MLASLPMYDLQELRAATDAWWAGLARAFARQGIADVPDHLDRIKPRHSTWRSPELLFSQICGYPFSNGFREDLAIVLTPVYHVPGCDGARYSSVLVVREDDTAQTLDDLDGSMFAVNSFDSWSGWHALRREILARGRVVADFAPRIVLSGEHRKSIEAVASGECRACAVDCVTHALLTRHAPRAVARTRALARTPLAPALPYVTSALTPADTMHRLRDGLAQALASPGLAETRAALAIAGAAPLTAADYAFMHEADHDGDEPVPSTGIL